jgi:hypothetical protein
VARGHALEGVCNERPRPTPGVGARLLLHLPYLACEVVADEVLRALEKLLTCLVHGQARDLLEGGECVPLGVAELLLQSLDVHLAIAESLLLALDLDESRVDLDLLLKDAFLDLRDLDATILNLALDLAP